MAGVAGSFTPGSKPKVYGLEQFRKNLSTYHREVSEELSPILNKAADPVVQDIRSRTPKLTGRLEQSIGETKVEISNDGKFITVDMGVDSDDVPYAVFVEFGTVNADAQPFLRPALEAKGGQAVGEMGDGIKSFTNSWRAPAL